MPHGISVDPQGNVWLTDVALHQAFRFKKNNFDQADLVLGEKFVPGSDDSHFCKPTVIFFWKGFRIIYGWNYQELYRPTI